MTPRPFVKRAGSVLFLLAGLLLAPHHAKAYVSVAGNVSGQSWAAGTYRVTGDLTVNSGSTLNLAPGAVLKFQSGTGLTVNGTLIAEGTADSLVVFTSRDDNTRGETLDVSDGVPAPGDWEGVYLYGYSGNQGSGQLEHCLWRYGGAVLQANLYCHYSDLTTIRDCRSEFSSQHGARLQAGEVHVGNSHFSGNALDGLSGGLNADLVIHDCRFDNNGDDGARLEAVRPHHLAGNGGSGNGLNAIAFHGTVPGFTLLEANEPGFCLVLSGTLSVATSDTLEVGPGCVIKGEALSDIESTGVMRFLGTADSLVVLTAVADDSAGGDSRGDGSATQPAPGDWEGVYSYGYSGNRGILEAQHTRFAYAGSGTRAACVYLYYSDEAHLDECRFDYSLAHGLRLGYTDPQVLSCNFDSNLQHGVYGVNSTPRFGACGFTGNGEYGAWLDGTPGTQDTGNHGSGNGTNAMMLRGTAPGSFSLAATGSGFCYVLGGILTVNTPDTLSIAPGTVFKGLPDSRLVINGALLAPGTAMQPIVFTSLHDDSAGGDSQGNGAAVMPAPGDWQGLLGYGYSGNIGRMLLDHTTVAWGGSGSSTASVFLHYSDEARLSDCRITNSLNPGLRSFQANSRVESCFFGSNLGYGLLADGGRAPDIHDCQFVGNGAAAARITDTHGNYGGNSGTGNALNGFELLGTVGSNRSWLANTGAFAYCLAGIVDVTVGDTLTLGSGSLVKGTAAGRLRTYGHLWALGTTLQPIRFTSLKDDAAGGDTNNDGSATLPAPGDWQGLEFYGYSGSTGTSRMEHCFLDYAGAGVQAAGILYYYADAGLLRNSGIGRSSGRGLRVVHSTPEILGTVFADNVLEAVAVDSGTPVFGSLLPGAQGLNTFSGNNGGGVQFRNSSPSTINAWFNNWGVYDPLAIDALIHDDNESAAGPVLFSPYMIPTGPPLLTGILVDTGAGTVRLSWTPVLDAVSYTVYSASALGAPFTVDTSGTFDGATWTAPQPGPLRIYRVTSEAP